MSNNLPGKNHDKMKNAVLFNAAKLFLEKGYTATTLKNIAVQANINIGSLMNLFNSKEDILCELVKYVLEGQFTTIEKLLERFTDDKILFYAAETTLQLYMSESNEYVRDLYSAAYSMPKSSKIIQYMITEKLENIFKEHLPHLETKDFYELEIASGGIIRGFMMVPCNMYFTMERKVRRFLETSFRIYEIPKEKTEEAIQFVAQFDFVNIAQEAVSSMLAYLEQKK